MMPIDPLPSAPLPPATPPASPARRWRLVILGGAALIIIAVLLLWLRFMGGAAGPQACTCSWENGGVAREMNACIKQELASPAVAAEKQAFQDYVAKNDGGQYTFSKQCCFTASVVAHACKSWPASGPQECETYVTDKRVAGIMQRQAALDGLAKSVTDGCVQKYSAGSPLYKQRCPCAP